MMICRSGTIIANAAHVERRVKRTCLTDTAEVNLQILGQFLSTGIARIHGDDDGKGFVEGHFVAVGEEKFSTALTFRLQQTLNLLCSHGEDG